MGVVCCKVGGVLPENGMTEIEALLCILRDAFFFIIADDDTPRAEKLEGKELKEAVEEVWLVVADDDGIEGWSG